MEDNSSINSVDGSAVKFAPFASSVESAFWVRYCQEKLERIQLNEDPFEIRGSFAVEGPARLQLQETSLQPDISATANERVSLRGSLIGFNTIESFQKVDKNDLLHDAFCPKFFKGELDVLTSFVLITFADLKDHKVLYWLGLPALLTRAGVSIRSLQRSGLKESWSDEDRVSLNAKFDEMRRSQPNVGLPPYFIYSKIGCVALSKEHYYSMLEKVTNDEVVFGFVDPTESSGADLSSDASVGWTMRNLMAYMSFHLNLGGRTVRILSCRFPYLHRVSSEGNQTISEARHHDHWAKSLILSVAVPYQEDFNWGDAGNPKYKVVGWELNARAKPGPRSINLRPLLDTTHLAIQAADLNLKLMKWRMIPTLDVALLQSTKVLLIGAGTLGCNVARVLLGWGIRKFKIVDYGNVSYSNPVRQSLFTLDDCRGESGGGKPKALAAADALRRIAADVECEGIVLSVPMPGHAEPRESVEESVQILDRLMQECDAAFLLTDTRESRWLPTVMAASHDKLLINAALGLDSWLVMRHGGHSSRPHRLGCYFCNDVVAPENSTRNRTLDQQCTVTRPGLAPISSAMAVELMVSLVHHAGRLSAPAPASGMADFSPTVSTEYAGPLGVMPHQIRGSVVSYTMMTPTVPAFRYCTGCSEGMIDAYQADSIQLVYDVCQSRDGTFLESVSGLTAFRTEAGEKVVGMEDWDEDEE